MKPELMFDKAPEALVAVDTQGRITAANPAAARLLGCTTDDALGRPLDSFHDPASPPASPFVAEPAPGDLQIPRGRRGRYRLVTVTALAHWGRYRGGGVHRLEDVSRRRLAERQQRLAWALLESINDVIVVHDTDIAHPRGGRVLFVNSAFEQLTGRRFQDIVGRRALDVFTGEGEIDLVNDIRATLGSQNDRQSMLCSFARGDDTHWVELRFTPILGGDGQISSYLALGRDVTAFRQAQHQSEANEQYLRAVFDQNPNPCFLMDLEGYLQAVNVAAREVLALPAEQIIGRSYEEFIAASERPRIRAFHDQARQGKTQHYEIRVKGSGDERLVEVTRVPIRQDGKVMAMATLMHDRTNLVAAQSRLALTAAALEQIDEGAAITDAEQRVVWANPAFLRMSGYEEAEMVGAPLLPMILDDTENAQLIEIRRKLDAEGTWSGQLFQRRKSGEKYPTLLTVSEIKAGSGGERYYIGIAKDLSEIREYQSRLQHMSEHDTLTGLANRVLFKDRLATALARGSRRGTITALLMLDLDQFKAINDSLGHAIGDRLLEQVGRRLLRRVRSMDTVARLGGDEYGVLIEELDAPQVAARIADQILRAIAEPFDEQGYELFVSASIGIACAPGDGDDGAALMRNAEAAMFRAKEEGRNTYRFYSPDLNARAHEYLVVANNLRYALRRDELELHYQPCVDLGSGRITSVEALLRWHHPELGSVSPATFIPIAEATGIIGVIGLWVLGTACRQAKRWQEAGFGSLRMAVNLSARQFRDANLVATVAQVLADTGLDGRYLELEITESTMMENPERAREVLSGLHGLGVTVAIDDFGTGYSSLSYLKQFAVDYLKIDRAFISDLPADEHDAALVDAILAMAHRLGLRVIAEGVEDAAQRDFLRDRGCEEAQGYLFSRPVPAHEFLPLLNSGRRFPVG